MKRKVYAAIASRVVAMENCQKSGNAEWFKKHGDRIDEIVAAYFPHGSGFDRGVTFDNVRSNGERLVFNTAFHHMDAHGYYDGWGDHSVIVTPSLAFGYSMRITGRDRNDIKEYIAQAFQEVLGAEIED